MSGVLERSLSVLETLAGHPEGCTLSSLAEAANMPVSGAHRLLADLMRCGYVRQHGDHGVYSLTLKLTSLGLNYLSRSGVVDVAKPFLDRLATESEELVRLAVVEGADLIFVAKSQGARGALRYDPDMGLAVPLSCSAAGHAWLSTMDDDRALALVARQGFGDPDRYGPAAPTTSEALLPFLRQARSRGFSMIVEVFAPGMAAMSAPIRRPESAATIGVVTIAGPQFRLTEQRMLALGPTIVEAAARIADASSLSAFFGMRAE